jgi:hypothetical protein
MKRIRCDTVIERDDVWRLCSHFRPKLLFKVKLLIIYHTKAIFAIQKMPPMCSGAFLQELGVIRMALVLNRLQHRLIVVKAAMQKIYQNMPGKDN